GHADCAAAAERRVGGVGRTEAEARRGQQMRKADHWRDPEVPVVPFWLVGSGRARRSGRAHSTQAERVEPGPCDSSTASGAAQPRAFEHGLLYLAALQGRFFSQPLSPNEFVFTVTDITNTRDAAYVLSFGQKADIPPFPPTGSGGHLQRITARKPTTVSGFGGQATYTTRVAPGDGDAMKRLSSSFLVFPEAWRVGSGI